ncbi:MAG: hypothetical protein R3E31_14390 [Chloroflexota bacterium]
MHSPANASSTCAPPRQQSRANRRGHTCEGLVIANDRDISRMRAARQNLNRLGLLNITTTTYDGSNFSKHAGTFDRILVDAPCGCEGTCRKDPSALQKASLNGSLKMAGPKSIAAQSSTTVPPWRALSSMPPAPCP